MACARPLSRELCDHRFVEGRAFFSEFRVNRDDRLLRQRDRAFQILQRDLCFGFHLFNGALLFQGQLALDRFDFGLSRIFRVILSHLVHR